MTNEAVDLDKCFEFVSSLVQKAGELIETRFNSNKNVQLKTCDKDLVTETDQEVEDLFINGLTAEFPTHSFFGEETYAKGEKTEFTDSPIWVIDPVDGTMNFVHSFPHTCISIALLVNKIPEIGIVYNPVLKQLFTARKGKGAFFNGNKINASGLTDIGKALVVTEFGTSNDPKRLDVTLENMRKIIEVAHGIRALGSAALNLCMVAMGAADVNFEYGLHAWDMAAGDLIVREAGGVTMDPSGGPLDFLSRRVLAAGSKELADEMVKLVTQFYPEPRD